MDNGHGLDDHLQDEVDSEDILDDVLGGGDVIDDFHSLKGMISGALGSLGYKFSILIVLLFNFTYTAYNAFARSAKSEISVVSLNNCSCDPSDRAFYSFTIFGFTALWVLFLVFSALYNTWNCCTCDHDRGTNSIDDDNTDNGVSNRNVNTFCTNSRKDLSKSIELIPDKHFWFLKRELKKIITMVLYLNIKRLHSHNDSLKLISLTKKHMLAHMGKFLKFPQKKFKFVFNKAFKFIKFMLVGVQFVLRLPIVPLLLVQWLDEYSWNCVFGSMKDYCKETTVGYTFDQSMVISFLYMCVLLSIIIGIFIKSMPVKILLSNKETSRSKLCLPFQVNNTLFLTNVSFILIIALIYTSVLSQFTYVAVTETERDINSGRMFTIAGKWFNRSISGGVTNSVLWKCSEEPNAKNLKVFFLTLLTLLIAITILYATASLAMAFFNYQKLNKLIGHYYGDGMQDSIFRIAMILHNLFQPKQSRTPKLQNEIENKLLECWNNVQEVSTGDSRRWYHILFLIPAFEFILILILFLLVLTSYNVYPIGCFFSDVHYDEETSTVILDVAEGVYIYQQVAIVTSVIISLTLILFKFVHISLAVTHHNPTDNAGHDNNDDHIHNPGYDHSDDDHIDNPNHDNDDDHIDNPGNDHNDDDHIDDPGHDHSDDDHIDNPDHDHNDDDHIDNPGHDHSDGDHIDNPGYDHNDAN